MVSGQWRDGSQRRFEGLKGGARRDIEYLEDSHSERNRVVLPFVAYGSQRGGGVVAFNQWRECSTVWY